MIVYLKRYSDNSKGTIKVSDKKISYKIDLGTIHAKETTRFQALTKWEALTCVLLKFFEEGFQLEDIILDEKKHA